MTTFIKLFIILFSIYAQVLDRIQMKSQLVVVPISCFIPILIPKSASRLPTTESHSVYVLLQEESGVWINVITALIIISIALL